MFNDELDKRFRSFQFHKGTIKTTGRLVMSLCLFDFNSIKVRLKQYDQLTLTQ